MREREVMRRGEREGGEGRDEGEGRRRGER